MKNTGITNIHNQEVLFMTPNVFGFFLKRAAKNFMTENEYAVFEAKYRLMQFQHLKENFPEIWDSFKEKYDAIKDRFSDNTSPEEIASSIDYTPLIRDQQAFKVFMDSRADTSNILSGDGGTSLDIDPDSGGGCLSGLIDLIFK